jgi:DNA-binding NarL/FixJ family response regulator
MDHIPSNKIIKILLIEDHPVFRESMVYLLNSNENFVCTAYAKGEEAFKNINEDQPEIVIMDINLPGMSGIQCTQMIKEKYPSIQIMMCTVYEDDAKIFEALKAGASGYLLKRAAIDEIFDSIMSLHYGGSPMSPLIARKVVASFQRDHAANLTDGIISDREQEILNLMSEGFRSKEIAAKLFISINTVRTHVRNIYEKLHVSSKIEALNKVSKNTYRS